MAMPNASMADKIIIRDLALQMSAGIYDHEKTHEQRVVVNITLDVVSNHGRALSGIDDVVSYEDIANSVSEIAARKHYDLIEEFAELIANMCLSDERVLCATIRVEKPDIIDNVSAVGVEIVRSR